jgi:ADP-ribose pyrophosphatase YjhB (NUDIX family)
MADERGIRVSAKAVIVSEGRALLCRNVDDGGDWYCLPGGGQRHGETLVEAVRRECLEEIGTFVKVGRLLFVRDYVARHHEFAATDPHAHQVELMFECAVPAGYVAGGGATPDSWQAGVEWVALSALAGLRMYPSALRELLPRLAAGELIEAPVYLGDVN